MGTLNLIVSNIELYILVFARIAGIVIFNPLFTVNAIPSRVRTVITFGVTVLLTPMLQMPDGYEAGSFDFLLCFGKEIVIGFLLSYVFNIFYYLLMTAGDVLDMNFGFAMAKVLDPGTNIQSAFTAKMLNLLFVFYFFATNSHLMLIQTAVQSYELFPIGGSGLSLYSAARFSIGLFANVFGLVIKLAVPFVAVELISEISMGILMKLIPQIHIFVIHVQIKIIFAIGLLFVLAGPIAAFIDNYILIMFDNMQNALQAAAGGA